MIWEQKTQNDVIDNESAANLIIEIYRYQLNITQLMVM